MGLRREIHLANFLENVCVSLTFSSYMIRSENTASSMVCATTALRASQLLN